MCAVHTTLRRLAAFASVGIVAFSVAGGGVRGQTAPRKKLLFLTHAALYKHSSLAPAEAAVTEYGKAGGFDVTTLEGYKQDSAKLDMSFLTPEYLAQFDGLMLMTNGNLPLTDAAEAGDRRLRAQRQGAGRRALRLAHAVRLPGVRRGAGRLLPPVDRADQHGRHRRSACSRSRIRRIRRPGCMGGSWPLAEEFYQFGTAVWDASRADRADQPGGTAAHPDGLLTRSRARAAQPRHRQDRHQRPRPGDREGRRLPAGLVAHVRQRPLVLHVARPPRRHLVHRSRSSARTSPAASAGRWGSRTGIGTENSSTRNSCRRRSPSIVAIVDPGRPHVAEPIVMPDPHRRRRTSDSCVGRRRRLASALQPQ